MADCNAILQVKVWLTGISLMIRRRVLVPATFALRELHGLIQVAMQRWTLTVLSAFVPATLVGRGWTAVAGHLPARSRLDAVCGVRLIEHFGAA